MLINYKKATVNDIKDKTLYRIFVDLIEEGCTQEYEMSSSGLINCDTGCTCGNFLDEVLVFEDKDEAIEYAKHAIEAYRYNKSISLVQVVPTKFNPEFFEGNMTDDIETLDELNFNVDIDNATEIKLDERSKQ